MIKGARHPLMKVTGKAPRGHLPYRRLDTTVPA